MSDGGGLIAEARKRAGITQQELASRLGSHQSVIARWESGRVRPDLETVQRVVRAAGFDLSLSIVPADDHDLTLIRRELRIAPHERLRSMVDAVRAFRRMGVAGGRV
jgi:transcriptional regulator with XRE-family HTH domain